MTWRIAKGTVYLLTWYTSCQRDPTQTVDGKHWLELSAQTRLKPRQDHKRFFFLKHTENPNCLHFRVPFVLRLYNMCLSLIGDSFNFKFKAGKGIHFLNLIWSVSPSSIEWPTSSFWRLGLCHLSGWERGRETFYNIRYPTISIRLPFAVPEARAPSSIERSTSAFWRLGLCHDGFVDEREREEERDIF